MKIKLSDYILEQSISTASIDDITLEQLKAELCVDIAINEFYIKNYNMGLFQEVAAQPAQAQDNPMQKAKDYQAPDSSYVQYNDEYEQNFQNAFNSIFEKGVPLTSETSPISSYTATDGKDYYMTFAP